MYDSIVSFQTTILSGMMVAIVVAWWPIARKSIRNIPMTKIYHLGFGLFALAIGIFIMRNYSLLLREFQIDLRQTITPIVGLGFQMLGGYHMIVSGILPMESEKNAKADTRRGWMAVWAGTVVSLTLFLLGWIS